MQHFIVKDSQAFLYLRIKLIQIDLTVTLISHASKVMLKILQARLQPYVNCELPDVQAGLRKGKGTRDKIPNNNLIY